MRNQFIRTACVLSFIACSITSNTQAAPFVNLDFEHATVLPPGSPTIFADSAFPGWTASIDETLLTGVYYNRHGIGEPFVALYDQPSTDLGIPLLQGQYMALLGTRADLQSKAILSQTGDVLPEIRSIRMRAEGNRGPPVVVLGGQVIPMVFLSGSPAPGQPAIFGGDVSSFAGNTVELRLVSVVPPSGTIAGVDDVQFSSIPIPEPSSGFISFVTAFVITRRARTFPLTVGCKRIA